MTKTEKAEYKAKRMARLIEAQRIVATGKCPQCGTGLIRNTSLTGWYQCGGYAAASHRQPGFENAPKCDFQIFYDLTSEEHAKVLVARVGCGCSMCGKPHVVCMGYRHDVGVCDCRSRSEMQLPLAARKMWA